VHGCCGALLTLAALAAPSSARAQTPAPAEALATSVSVFLSEPLRTSVPETWGDRGAVGLRVTGDAPREALDAVTRAMARNLAAQARVVVLAAGDDLGGAVEAARAAGTPRLVRVAVRVAQGALHASTSLLVVDAGPWGSFLAAEPPRPTLVASAQSSAAAAPATPWPAPGRPRVVATPFHATVALSIADLDGDGRAELVIVTADRVRVARMTGASLAFVRDAAGSAGAVARAPVPLRQPLGAAERDAARPIVRYRTSCFAAMGEVSLAAGVARVRSLGVDLYPAAGLGCVALRAGSHLVAGVVSTCDATPPAPVQGAVAAVPVAYEQTLSDGTLRRWEVRATGAGQAEVRRDGAVFATLDDVAPPALLEDLDGDGRVELVTASASAPGGPDRVRVFSLHERVEERAAINVPGSVEALAAGDLDGDGRRELVVSVQDPARRTATLWIVP
jgi:hypothetical protein